jgi:hypothetical protein
MPYPFLCQRRFHSSADNLSLIPQLIVAKVNCVYKQETNQDPPPPQKELENFWAAYSFCKAAFVKEVKLEREMH